MANGQTINVTVELDRGVKESGEALFRDLGVNFSVAVNTLVQQAVVRGQIEDEQEPPIEAAESEEEYYAEIRRRVADLDAGRNVVYANPIRVALNAE